MPGDNAAPVAINAPVEFPTDGPTNGVIVRSGASAFVLPAVGIYEVSYQVSTDEPGQLAIWLNGIVVAGTRAGRATGTNQISNTVLITTLVPASVLTIRNDVSPAALTITPFAGGTGNVNANLTIKRLA